MTERQTPLDAAVQRVKKAQELNRTLDDGPEYDAVKMLADALSEQETPDTVRVDCVTTDERTGVQREVHRRERQTPICDCYRSSGNLDANGLPAHHPSCASLRQPPEASGENATECCDAPIGDDRRYCPKCGWEARIIAASGEAERLAKAISLVKLCEIADAAVNAEGLDWYGTVRPNQVVSPVVGAIWVHLQAVFTGERVRAALSGARQDGGQ